MAAWAAPVLLAGFFFRTDGGAFPANRLIEAIAIEALKLIFRRFR